MLAQRDCFLPGRNAALAFFAAGVELDEDAEARVSFVCGLILLSVPSLGCVEGSAALFQRVGFLGRVYTFDGP